MVKLFEHPLCSIFLLLLALILPANNVVASDTITEIDLGSVVLTESRVMNEPVSEAKSPGRSEVIPHEEIASRNPVTLGQFLEKLPGLTGYDNGGNEFSRTLSARGFSSGEDILILVDGVPVNNRSDNRVDFQTLPDPEIIRSIDVIYGPNSAMFGAPGASSVINITTRSGPVEPRLKLSLGSFESRSLHLSRGGTRARWNYFISGNVSRRDGYRDNSDAEINELNFQADRDAGHYGDLNLSLNVKNSDVGSPNHLTDTELQDSRRQTFTPKDYREIDLNRERITYAHGKSEQVSIYSSIYRQEKETFFRTTSRIYGSVSRINDAEEILGGRLTATTRLRPLGVPNRINFGTSFSQTDREFLLDGAASSADRDEQRKTQDFFVEDRLFLTRSFNISLGLRDSTINSTIKDRENDTTFEFDYLPSSYNASAEYEMVPNLTFYGKYGEAFKPPGLDDMAYMGGPFVDFNPDLKPEETYTRELGVQYKHGGLEAEISGYEIETKNEITFVDNTNKNLDETTRLGGESTFKLRLSDNLSLDGGYTYLKPEISKYASAPENVGNRIPMVPDHQANASIKYREPKKYTLSLQGSYVGKRYLMGDESNERTPLDEYYLLNFTGRWSYDRNTSLNFGIDNLLDSEYNSRGIVTEDLLGNKRNYYTPAPVRNFHFGIKKKF